MNLESKQSLVCKLLTNVSNQSDSRIFILVATQIPSFLYGAFKFNRTEESCSSSKFLVVLSVYFHESGRWILWNSSGMLDIKGDFLFPPSAEISFGNKSPPEMCFPWFPSLISSNNVRYVTLTTMGNLITKSSDTILAFQTDAASSLLTKVDSVWYQAFSSFSAAGDTSTTVRQVNLCHVFPQ